MAALCKQHVLVVQVMEVVQIDDNFDAIVVDGEVRTGYRMKLVVSGARTTRAAHKAAA
jgi:hypothetical protein